MQENRIFKKNEYSIIDEIGENMITFFTCPKPFSNKHIEIIQRNAIRSWTFLQPTPEIILLGNEKGISDVSKDLKVRNIPDIKYNQRGIPMLNSIFETALANSNKELICYINSDIILLQDFMKAIETVNTITEDFLVVGQRWDVDITQLIDFYSSDSIKKLRLLGKNKGKLHAPSGIDFHLSSVRLFKEIKMPSFVLGRGHYDQWLLWKARSLNFPVIDITPIVKIFHQNHDYSHISVDAKNWMGSPNNPDSLLNRSLAGKWLFRYNLNQASHLLTPKGLKYKFIHPFLEPFFITAKLFIDLGVGELLDNVPSIKRALKLMIEKTGATRIP